MEQGPAEIGEHGEEGRRLPPALAVGLSPRLRHALDQPVRRRILRVLNDSDGPRSPEEITLLILPQPALSFVSYHVRVLVATGCAQQAGTREGDGRVVPLYASSVAENRNVLSVLQATRQLDRADA